MSQSDDHNDPTDLIPSMGWEPLSYGCVGLLRNRELGSETVWSWLILIPWAVNDSKPWIDGNKLYTLTTLTEAQQRDEVLNEMRGLLDTRYGESVAGQAVDDFLREIEGDA